MTEPHLEGAARAWLEILRELHPEHHWVVRVREADRADAGSDPGWTSLVDQPGAPADHPHPVGDGNGEAAGVDWQPAHTTYLTRLHDESRVK